MVLLSAPQDASYGHQSGHHWHHNSNTGGALFTFYERFHASFLILLAFLSFNVQNICILLSFGCAAAFVCIFLRNGLFSRPLQCMACLHFHICTLNICLACLCSSLHIMLAHIGANLYHRWNIIDTSGFPFFDKYADLHIVWYTVNVFQRSALQCLPASYLLLDSGGLTNSKFLWSL